MGSTSANRCFACPSRECFTRIYTDDLDYDEVACKKHVEDLAKEAAVKVGERGRRHDSRAMLQREPRPKGHLHWSGPEGCLARRINRTGSVTSDRGRLERAHNRCGLCWRALTLAEARRERGAA